jgi:hypothetical protein
MSASRLQVEFQSAPDAVRDFHHIIPSLYRTHKTQGLLPTGAGKISEPFLALLTEVDGFQEVGARRKVFRSGHSPEIRDWHALFRRFWKEEKTHWNVSRPGELLELLEGRSKPPRFPIHELGKTAKEGIGRIPRTLPGPA